MASAVDIPVRRIAIIGNPNAGKTSIFNSLTGLRQHVANYPGVTVEKKEGKVVFEDGSAANARSSVSTTRSHSDLVITSGGQSVSVLL